ncbi:histone-like nucleoid-structuring protein Lsr2 [Blastococcus sp. CT_GayMR19]|uniref:exonuclease domain-containing protein n=1 Tax=Blastococcus sp. CT_GayMR19 TaxID=2559608 RepID=UPI0014320AEB|nr:histone-like nucleoid-structuring protein Lsr2 [Blastococcus sp. CT_GayMR19]
MPSPRRSPALAPAATGPLPGFAVIDVETTGLSANSHRILEMAIVRTDSGGRVLDEWVCRFDPEGPVGATHIHGIRDADVMGAPRFAHVLPEISTRLAGAAIAGHNVTFDLAFLRTEYARAGWALPHLPAACTLEHSWDHLPQLNRRRLADCCDAVGISLHRAHSALHDARATARLLASYLDPTFGHPPRRELLDLPHQGWAVAWPTAPGGVRPPAVGLPIQAQRKIATWAAPPAPPLVTLLEDFRLADALDEGAPEGSLAYLELLAEVLEDGVLTDDERAALVDIASIYDLDGDAVHAAHSGFLLALAHLALDDGKVSRAEKAELTTTAEMLDVPTKLVTATLDAAEAARHERLSAGLRPLPADWALDEPLRVGDKVAFTGCEWTVRERLEQRAEELGVRVMNTVSSRTALLVTDDSFSGGKADEAAGHGTRCVHPDEFAVLLKHLQPAVKKALASFPRPRTARDATVKSIAPAAAGIVSAAHATVCPAAVRAWARANGHEVGERGRLPAELSEAYQRAHEATGQA